MTCQMKQMRARKEAREKLNAQEKENCKRDRI